jgi:hypothetical protein
VERPLGRRRHIGQYCGPEQLVPEGEGGAAVSQETSADRLVQGRGQLGDRLAHELGDIL